MIDFNLAQAFITALTGSPDTVCNWRIINDRVKGEQCINLKGSLSEVASTLEYYNSMYYGVFITINAIKPTSTTCTLEDIDYIRTQVVDVDDVLTAQDSYQQAINSSMPPHFAVQSSAGKFHLYWLVEPYVGNDFYSTQQRKLRQLYNGDKSVVDATRVLRVPGFYHCKGEPQLINCWSIYNGPRYNSADIAKHLETVNVVERFSSRRQLGDAELAAPSLEWLKTALYMLNPNEMSRDDWMAITAAFKQAGWCLATEQVLLEIWQEWCSKYTQNDLKENMKLWNSIKDSEVGWGRFGRLTNINAYYNNNPDDPHIRIEHTVSKEPITMIPVEAIEEPTTSFNSPILNVDGKKEWFKNCFFVEREGRIFSPTGRFMNQTQFNGRYGGKEFTLKEAGAKLTDEPWKAALRSSDWSIPKVDHVRFLPQRNQFEVVVDEMGRKGLNTYIPARIKTVAGDVSIWTDYLRRIFNTAEDIKIFNDYIAHCIKFPGYKIPWSILFQSAKGVGKQMIGDVVKKSIGESYTYQPDAEELVSSVSQFNGWMRNKLMIIVDEVRVGDRYDLMNGLKTIITDRRIAIESKGVDQEMEDNVANWLFFTNHKDAFPIDENERRYCIFYSSLQSARNIEDAGLTKDFFDNIYRWLRKEEGYEKIANWYLNYPIAKGSLSHRAPETSSYQEVLKVGRSPLRVLLDDKILIGEKGFRGGFVSFTMFQKAVADSSMRSKPAEHILKAIIESKGLNELGWTAAPVPGEDLTRPSLIYGLKGLRVEDYERSQM